MTDTYSEIAQLIKEITGEEEKTPRYKARLFKSDGSQTFFIRGLLTEDALFKDAQDIEEKLLPLIEAYNNDPLVRSPIVRIESYYVREHNVASLDLNIKTGTTTEIDGGWKRLA